MSHQMRNSFIPSVAVLQKIPFIYFSNTNAARVGIPYTVCGIPLYV